MIIKKYKHFNEDSLSQDEVNQQEILSKDSKKKGLSTIGKGVGLSAIGAGVGSGIGYFVGKKRDMNDYNSFLQGLERDRQDIIRFYRNERKDYKTDLSKYKSGIPFLKEYQNAVELHRKQGRSGNDGSHLLEKFQNDNKKGIRYFKKKISENRKKLANMLQSVDDLKKGWINKGPEIKHREYLSKKGAAIGALATAATAAAAYGGYKLYKHYKNKKKEDDNKD